MLLCNQAHRCLAQSSSNKTNALAAGDTWPGLSRSNFRSWFTILAASELISSVLGEVQYEILPISSWINLLAHHIWQKRKRLCFIFIQYSYILNNFVKLFKSAIFKDFDPREINFFFFQEVLISFNLSKIFYEIWLRFKNSNYYKLIEDNKFKTN